VNHPRSIQVGILSAIIIILAWILVEPAAAGILLIIAGTIIISLEISADAARHLHPEIFVSLKEDARTVWIENLGTAPAYAARVTIIPDDIRYEIGNLDPDQNHQYRLPEMVREARAAVSWEKKDGTRVEKFFELSGYSRETDPLKPTFPLFSWK
jgi:hypothetical protein